MKNHSFIHAVLGAALFTMVGACGDDNKTTEGASTDGTTNGTTMGTTTTVGTTDDQTTTTNNPTTGDNTNTQGTTNNNTTSPTTTAGTTDTGGDGFIFPTDPFDAYTQIDRHGAVEAGTAGIRASAGLGLMGEDIAIRDDYNASNPVEDVKGTWVPEIGESVTFFHDAFDQDLMDLGLGLMVADFDTSIAQAGPVIIPDAIKYDPSMPTGYPNGRALTDQVVDITLAAVLLDLSVHPLDTFASLPLNPPTNDVEFLTEFPFLAAPH